MSTKRCAPPPDEGDEWSDAASVAPARRGAPDARPPPPKARAELCGPAPVSATVEMLRKQRLPRGVGAPEVKYLSTMASTGVLSQNTWSNADQLSNISAGTGQANRLGREIRLRRLRFSVFFSDQAADTMCGLSFLERVDPTVAGSDIFATNGSSRAQLDYPNPAVVRKVYHHTVGTAMTYAGAAFGTTPSYAAVCLQVDVDFGRNGKLIQYDLGGAVVGPSPIAWFITTETSISADVGTQIWFTDA